MDALPHTGPRAFRSAEAVARFCLAGNARVTLVSKRTEARYTFRIAAPHKDGAFHCDEPVRFVSLLTGPDNGADYTFLGFIPEVDHPAFRTTTKTRLRSDSAPVKAARFLCERVIAHPEAPLPADLEIWHEGKCGKCGRTLTTPESISRGIGPECWAKLGG